MLDAMRTTLDIDAMVLRDLKRIQREEDKSLGAIASELLAQALRARQERSARKRPFKLKSYSMGALKVDLEDKEAVQALLDQEDYG